MKSKAYVMPLWATLASHKANSNILKKGEVLFSPLPAFIIQSLSTTNVSFEVHGILSSAWWVHYLLNHHNVATLHNS
jgi:hypothetical protein